MVWCTLRNLLMYSLIGNYDSSSINSSGVAMGARVCHDLGATRRAAPNSLYIILLRVSGEGANKVSFPCAIYVRYTTNKYTFIKIISPLRYLNGNNLRHQSIIIQIELYEKLSSEI